MVRTIPVLIVAAVLAACGKLDLLSGSQSAGSGSTTCPKTAAVATITLAAEKTSIVVGSTAVVTATTKNVEGALISAAVGWNSSNFSAATVERFDDTRGLATGLNVGTASITACHGDVVSSPVTITVTPGAPSALTIVVAPSSALVSIGGTKQFIATVQDENGADRTGTVSIEWRISGNPFVASLSTKGLATGLAAGQTRIAAFSGGFSSVPVILTVQ